MLAHLRKDMKKIRSPKRAEILQRFFKTGPEEYGEGDVFLGITVPESRKIATHHKNLPLKEVQALLQSRIHEERLIALLILVHKYEENQKHSKSNKQIYDFYLKNIKSVNNWDLVDISAPKIIGDYLLNKNTKILYKLAKSKNLWERRIAILSTFRFIREYDFKDTLRISEILLTDNHDLIHKAVGWMLREIGKKNQAVEEKFLKKHCKTMPRTMLRYAIERFSKGKKSFYMKK